MVLLTSLGAASCDVLILTIHSSLTKHENESSGYNIQSTLLLTILAGVRIFLLVGPLSYHVVSGRRLKWGVLYFIFYCATMILILGHMFAILLQHFRVDGSVVPTNLIDPDLPDSSLGVSVTNALALFLPYVTYMHRVWVILFLSMGSVSLHFVLLAHVRSTAPESVEMDRGRRDARKKKRILAYAASSQIGLGHKRSSPNLDSGANENYKSIVERDDPKTTEDDERMFLMLDEESNDTYQNSVSEHTSNMLGGGINANNDYNSTDDMWSELQYRLQLAKDEWTSKLDDLQRQMQRNSLIRSDSGRKNKNIFIYFQLSPFRVLLELFAYKEVLSNGRLDACWDLDDGAGLTFYVPQLLSFLLHGAFLNAPELETWVLDKCEKNVHFAHRCFWFLRAWCLGSGSHHLDDSENALGAISDDEALFESNRKRLQGSETNLYQFPATFSSSSTFNIVKHERSKSLEAHSAPSLTTVTQIPSKGSKFPVHEHRLIEALLFRVIERGETPARALQFGSKGDIDSQHELNDDNDLALQDSLGSYLAATAEKGFIPLDPNNGFPSVKHLDVITARHRCGFMSASKINESSVNDSTIKHFFGAPTFLDALTALADDLMIIPREKRTKELRRRLKGLEVELLPSNVIYLPMQNMHHRVWRIVVDESIALSTKERVPCIICLEVVDYTPQDTSDNSVENREDQNRPSNRSKRSSLRQILNDWYKSDRNPQRHNTIFEQVSQNTQNLFKRWREELEHSAVVDGTNTWARIARRSIGVSPKPADADWLDADLEEVSNPLIKNDDFSRRTNDEVMSDDVATNVEQHALSSKHLESPLPPGKSQFVSPAKNMGQWLSSPRLDKSKKDEIETLRKRKIEQTTEQNIQNGARLRRSKKDKHIPVRTTVASNRSSLSLSQNRITLSANIQANIEHAADDGDSNEQRMISEGRASAVSDSKPPPVVFREDWTSKENRLRPKSAFGNNPSWRLLPIIVKSNDDLRQEQLSSQLIQRMAAILARGKVPVWLCPYEILALSDRGGIIEAIPDTISLDSLKRNYPNYTTLPNFFLDHFGSLGKDVHDGARANFVESLAAYSIVCYLLQIKDRHNGNILLDNKGHIIHIDFGFFFLSSPGKNTGFESAPFKLTSDFVDLMDGPSSRTFSRYRDLCFRTFIELRKHCYEITLLVEMLMEGNEDLGCFRGRPEEAVHQLRNRFRLDLNDRACLEYVNSLVDESLENWRTTWYDRYQRFCVGVL